MNSNESYMSFNRQMIIWIIPYLASKQEGPGESYCGSFGLKVIMCRLLTRKCRCGGKTLLVEKIVLQSCALLSSNISKFDCWPHKQICAVEKQDWSAVVLHVSNLKNPDWFNKNDIRKPSSRQSPSLGIIVLRTPQQFIINAIKYPKRKNRDEICPTFKPGKYSQASTGTPSED